MLGGEDSVIALNIGLHHGLDLALDYGTVVTPARGFVKDHEGRKLHFVIPFSHLVTLSVYLWLLTYSNWPC